MEDTKCWVVEDIKWYISQCWSGTSNYKTLEWWRKLNSIITECWSGGDIKWCNYRILEWWRTWNSIITKHWSGGGHEMVSKLSSRGHFPCIHISLPSSEAPCSSYSSEKSVEDSQWYKGTSVSDGREISCGPWSDVGILDQANMNHAGSHCNLRYFQLETHLFFWYLVEGSIEENSTVSYIANTFLLVMWY